MGVDRPMMSSAGGREGHLGLGRILRLGARKFSHRHFLEFQDRAYTYADFNAQVNVVASWLASTGLSNGDRVLLLSENSPNFVRAVFALGKHGVVSMPTNSMLTALDVAALIDLTRPAHVLAGEAYMAKARAALEASSFGSTPLSVLHLDDRITSADGTVVDPVKTADPAGPEPVPRRPVADDDLAMILFTSGSTGTPKGIFKSYSNIAWSAINHQISEPRRGGDRESFCLALAGIAFANFLLVDALAGATCVLEPGFDPNRLADTLAGKGITHVFLAPTMLAAMAVSRPDAVFPTVAVVETSFEFPLHLRQKAVAMFPNARVLWSFGSTEATMARTPPEMLLTNLTCVGYAGGLDDYRIDPAAVGEDVGEVQAFGPTVMMGYLELHHGDSPGAPVGVRDDGWFPTGDLGSLDAGGALHFAGRVKDMIKSGGTNVFAIDVELVLIEHPAVRNAAVIGIPDDHWGEIVAAVVETDDPAAVDLDSIRTFVTERLAPFRRPKRYFFVSDLPKNPTGKVAKGQLKERIAAREITPRE
jgi:fatty-acyl-CoA synthase